MMMMMQDNPPTVRFNVGGSIIETASWRHLLSKKYSESRLAKIINEALDSTTRSAFASFSSSKTQAPPKTGVFTSYSRPTSLTTRSPPTIEIFIDANPAAFIVLIDYIRHDRLFCPKTVPLDLVLFLLSEFGINPTRDEISQAWRAYSTTNTLEDEPPAYNNHRAPTSALNVGRLRLEMLVTQHLTPLISRHAELGHRSFEIVLCQPEVAVNAPSILRFGSDSHIREFVVLPETSMVRKSGHGEIPEPTLGFVKDAVGDLDVIVEALTGVRKVTGKVDEVRVRLETGFGLTDTVGFSVVVLDVKVV
ncbi:hypothetical protein HDU67_001464 [Dinochytrium kinnereticum]|nr:hypothetical protein HDU67_001464 [Dinochytrium kinnereticum]